MFLRLNEKPVVENLHHYPSRKVEELRNLLVRGTPAKADPHRKNFYEVEGSKHVYYIHVAPKGKVLLLAIWRNETRGAAIEAAFEPEC